MSPARNTPKISPRKLRLALVAGVVIAVSPSSSLADPIGKPSRFGAEVKGFQSGKALGVLYGWRFSAFESESFAMGGAGFTGQLSEDAGTFSYGGLLGTYSARLGKKLDLDLSLVAGGGGGTVSGDVTGGGVMLEPGVGLNVILGTSVRSVLGVGYIWTPATADFSGLTFGIRFDFLLYGGINAGPVPPHEQATSPGPQGSSAGPRSYVAPGAVQSSPIPQSAPALSSAPAAAVPIQTGVAREPASVAAPRLAAPQQPQQFQQRPAAPRQAPQPAAPAYAPVRR